MGINILVVDDETNANEDQKETLRNQVDYDDLTIDFVGNTEEALQRLKESYPKYPLVLADIKMPRKANTETSGEIGEEMIVQIAQTYPDIKLLIISAHYGEERADKYIQKFSNVLDFLAKPLDSKDLLKVIKQNFLESQAVNLQFDYAGLDSETADFLKTQSLKIKRIQKEIASGILEIGRYFAEIKSRIEHGYWEKWVQEEIGYHPATAWRFVKIYENFKSHNLEGLSISSSALSLLASPSVPDEVREEAIALARSSNQKSLSISQTQDLIIKSKSANPAALSEETQEAQPIPLETTQQSTVPKNTSTFQTSTNPVSVNKTEEIYKVRIKPRLWRLGERHLLYCGEPLSTEFKKHLPSKASLSLAFPPSPNYSVKDVVEANSYLFLSTIYDDFDPELLREMLKKSLELFTEGNEQVVISFLPTPIPLLVTHHLGCFAYMADPSRECCEAVIKAWEKTGGKIEEIR